MLNFRGMFCKHEPKLVNEKILGADKPAFKGSTAEPLSDVLRVQRQEAIVQVWHCEKCGRLWRFATHLFP